MKMEQTESSDTSDDIIKHTEERHILDCPMTDEELRDENVNLFRILQQQDDLKQEKKSFAADFKSREEKLTEMQLESRKKIRSKAIMRAIVCTLTLNFTKLTATLIRQDTDAKVNERPMNQDERNMLNATAKLPGMDAEEPADEEGTGEPVGDTLTFPETNITPTEPPDSEQLTEDEATQNATDKFGPDDDPTDISNAADLSDDEPEVDDNGDMDINKPQGDDDPKVWLGDN